MKLLQLNLNHCESAQDLLKQSLIEHKIDIAIISEQYRTPNTRNWFADLSDKAAIWISNRLAPQEVTKTEAGYVRVKINGINIYSCYMPPSWCLDQFKTVLDGLVNDARDRKPVIIAGDFNAWATEWGSRHTSAKGVALLEAFNLLDITLCNVGDECTFRVGSKGSIIDLTFVSESLVKSLAQWRVSDIYTHSDHKAILFQIFTKSQQPVKEIRGWRTKLFDSEICAIMMEDMQLSGTATEKAAQFTLNLNKACDAAMPRRGKFPHCKPVHWWNNNIMELRRKCHRMRRQAHRNRNATIAELLRRQYAESRKQLNAAIKTSKRACYQELCNEVNRDPWGRPYITVMNKLRKFSSPRCPIILGKIVLALFPKQPVAHLPTTFTVEDIIPPITEGELINASKKVGREKAPGPDQIPNRALLVAIETKPDELVSLLNSCLEEGIFPVEWKKQRLLLIPKGSKAPEDPSGYRPICLLDTIGKILERIVCDRLTAAVEIAGDLSDLQFGFRKARSTVEAITLVTSIAQKAVKGTSSRGSKKYCAVVALDVKNAFNSAQWYHIIRGIRSFKVPAYLERMIVDYFQQRVLTYDTEEGIKTYGITGGVPQGSVLGPTLWNIMYDGIFKLPLPAGVTLVGFADDIALVAVAKLKEEISRICNESIDMIHSWLQSVGLNLADHKTEAVLITHHKVKEQFSFCVGDQVITSRDQIKYLGVMIDARLSFKPHLESICAKAAKVSTALSWLMPNIGGPSQDRRGLLFIVANSIILYAAPTWVGALDKKSNTRVLTPTHRRGVLRVCCAFRTVSYDAACVVAGMIPIVLLARERRTLYDRRHEPLSHTRLQKEVRCETLREWQCLWSVSQKGRWTYRLIPTLEEWMNRPHGKVDFNLTQFLTGHGCFRNYLHKFGHDSSDECPTCRGTTENAEHVFFECPRFASFRAELCRKVNAKVKVENVMQLMLQSEDTWKAVQEFATSILKLLRSLEQRRKR